MRAATLLAIGAALLVCACPALAIYEDQAGQYDWLKQHVGRVTLAKLVSKPRPRLFVASEAGAVAEVSTRDGSLLWRRVLAEGESISHLHVASGRVITLSGAGSQLLAWDAESGAAVWAAAPAGSEDASAIAGGIDAAVADGGDTVVVVIGSTAKVSTGALPHSQQQAQPHSTAGLLPFYVCCSSKAHARLHCWVLKRHSGRSLGNIPEAPLSMHPHPSDVRRHPAGICCG